jgi:hypothetical protein
MDKVRRSRTGAESSADQSTPACQIPLRAEGRDRSSTAGTSHAVYPPANRSSFWSSRVSQRNSTVARSFRGARPPTRAFVRSRDDHDADRGVRSTRPRHVFNSLGAATLTRPGASRAAASLRARPLRPYHGGTAGSARVARRSKCPARAASDPSRPRTTRSATDGHTLTA